MSTWIRTYTGKRFDPLSKEPGEISIEDIAHALSNICRYTGHCKSFYSVAQHSVLVARILNEQGYNAEIQLQGLLHDATEAYMNDIARPIKHADAMAGYRQIEDQLERIIAAKFGFETLTPDPVKKADMICLATETRDLMGDPQDWGLPEPPMPWGIQTQSPAVAKFFFINRFADLMRELRRNVS